MSAYHLTLFPDRYARSAESQSFTAEDLTDLIRSTSASAEERLPMLKMASFGNRIANPKTGCLRHDGNLLSLHGIEADYDGEEWPMEAPAKRLREEGIEALLYTSPSHRPEKPRWRVLVPIGLRLPEIRYRLVSRLNGALGDILAPESWTLSTAYYYGRVTGNPPPEVVYVPGNGVEFTWRSDFAEVGPPATTGPRVAVSRGSGCGPRSTGAGFRVTYPPGGITASPRVTSRSRLSPVCCCDAGSRTRPTEPRSPTTTPGTASRRSTAGHSRRSRVRSSALMPGEPGDGRRFQH